MVVACVSQPVLSGRYTLILESQIVRIQRTVSGGYVDDAKQRRLWGPC